jgi:high-affinity Fe2+/Pb2+ permease
MEYSLPAWMGALAGTVVAVVIYVAAIGAVGRHLRKQAGPQTSEQRAAFEEKFSIARRLILAVDVAILATVGYWIGLVLGGPGPRY